MKVIRPSLMSPELLIATNIPEIYDGWLSTTTYNIGDRVSRTYLGTYESLTNGNINNTPESLGANWLRIGPTNNMAMFDTQISTSSTSSSNIVVTVKTGSVDSIALLNIVASSAILTIRDSQFGDIIYGPVEKSLQPDVLLDWYDYFYFEQVDQRTQALFLGLPIGYTDAHATVELIGTGTVSIGYFAFGLLTDLGRSEYGMSAGITDYSTKETDSFGNTTFLVRSFSKRVSADIQVDNAILNRVQRILYGLRASPAVWIASDDLRYEEMSVVFGFYRDFTTTVSYPTVSRCSLEIEGLI